MPNSGRSAGASFTNGARIVVAFLIAIPSAQAQQAPGWKEQIDELRALLMQTRAQLERSGNEIQELKRQLEEIKKQDAGSPPAQGAPETTMFPTATILSQGDSKAEGSGAASEIKEQQDLLAAQIEEHEQSKVESASKYRLRLSGMVLMNTFSNRGTFDMQDMPSVVFPPDPGARSGSVGATFRQTLIGLDLSGPAVGGARTAAELQMDFFGGFPALQYGVTAGLVRLRVARLSLEWPHTTIIAGQDAPFFSPRSPTSFATVGEPAFSWSGNLWVWTPQIRVERKWTVSEQSSFTLSAGVLDPLTEETPEYQSMRVAGVGEQSRQPGLATHAGWKSSMFGREFALGAGAFYARQAYSFGRDVNSWAATADWNIPFGSRLELSGEFFRGQALGGLGGGIWRSAIFNGNPTLAASSVIGLNAVGGWSQLKMHALPNLEFNLAGGTDNPLASDLRHFSDPSGLYFPPLARNQSWFLNGIYHPRSNLMLALEYRKLRTYFLQGLKQSGDHVNLAIGVSF